MDDCAELSLSLRCSTQNYQTTLPTWTLLAPTNPPLDGHRFSQWATISVQGRHRGWGDCHFICCKHPTWHYRPTTHDQATVWTRWYSSLHSGTSHSEAGLPGSVVYAHTLHLAKPGAQPPGTSCHSRPPCPPKGGQPWRATTGQVPFHFHWSRGTKGRPIRDTAQARYHTLSLNTKCASSFAWEGPSWTSTYVSTGCHCPSQRAHTLVFWNGCSAQKVWPGTYLCGQSCSSWECFAWSSPPAYGWWNHGPDGWSIRVQQTGCELWLCADSSAWKFPEVDHFYHPLWLLLFQETAICHQQCSRVLSTADECNPGWTQRGTVPHGWHFNLRTWPGWTWCPPGCRTQIHPSGWSHPQCRQVLVLADKHLLPGSHQRPEWGFSRPGQNSGGLADDHTLQHHRTLSILRNGEPTWEVFTQTCWDISAPSWATWQALLLDMGTHSGSIVPAHQRGAGQTINICSVEHNCVYKDLCRCLSIRVGSGTASETWGRLETCCFCLQVYDRHWTVLLPDWKGGSHTRLGLWEVPRLCFGQAHRPRDWPQAPGPSDEHNQLRLSPSTSPAVQTTPHVVFLFHLPCYC